jgi:hypothetical protein
VTGSRAILRCTAVLDCKFAARKIRNEFSRAPAAAGGSAHESDNERRILDKK